jgi:hypothetical protein
VATDTTEAADAAVTHKKSRDRSPNYPGISLEAAVKRARTLYEKERRNFTNSK